MKCSTCGFTFKIEYEQYQKDFNGHYITHTIFCPVCQTMVDYFPVRVICKELNKTVKVD